MPGKTNKKLAVLGDTTEDFIFSWTRRHPGTFWLWAFIVLSLLLHAFVFYLFQVVYPSSGRVEPFPSRVLILDEKKPGNATLLKELDDRLVFLQAASNGSESRKNMDDFSVSFRPSFANREPPFREPTEKKPMLPDSAAMFLPNEATVYPPFNMGGLLDPGPVPAKDAELKAPAATKTARQ